MSYYLENKMLKIQFDAKTGSITGLFNKITGWQVIRQPKLAAGIRLLVPVENYRNNRVLSENQSLSTCRKANNNEMILSWERVFGDKSGELDISVELKVSLNEDAITFDMTIYNKSEYIVEEAWCPCLGGIREPLGEQALESLTMNMCGGFQRAPLGNGFPQQCGYWGTDHPTFIRTFPSGEVEAPFVLLSNGQQGIYLGMHDQELNLVTFVHELKPGYIDSKHNRVPISDEVSGKPAGFNVSAVRMPFIKPGEEVKLASMEVSFFKGDWHQGLKPYIDWKKNWYVQKNEPAWLNDIDCWISLHINSPEGCCRYTYRELPDFAREAKEKGVQVIQLIGWARDGQDGAEPYQDIDPRLGTREELKAAINEIETMGMKILLMCKFKWADQSIPEYKNEMLQHTVKDMYGNPIQFPGYAYQTLAQQIGANIRNGAGLCHLSEEFRQVAMREFEKILDLGSSGILYDELPSYLICFEESHGHRWGESNAKGGLKLAEDFYEMAKKLRGEFLLTGEGPNDAMSQYYPVNYIRTFNNYYWVSNHLPVWKYLNPNMKFATCLTGFDDREMINECIAFGYIINYEPYNFKGRISDIPLTVKYGQEAQILRRQLREYLWDGTFTHTLGADLELTNNKTNYIYTVFISRTTGKKAVVVVNHDENNILKGKVSIGQSNCVFELYSPGDPMKTVQTDGCIHVQPRSLVVLVES